MNITINELFVRRGLRSNDAFFLSYIYFLPIFHTSSLLKIRFIIIFSPYFSFAFRSNDTEHDGKSTTTINNNNNNHFSFTEKWNKCRRCLMWQKVGKSPRKRTLNTFWMKWKAHKMIIINSYLHFAHWEKKKKKKQNPLEWLLALRRKSDVCILCRKRMMNKWVRIVRGKANSSDFLCSFFFFF